MSRKIIEKIDRGRTPVSNDTNDIERAPSGSPEDVLRYLREMRGEDDAGE
jgi:hypothetical protein